MLSLYSSVGRVQELRTGGHWFNPQQGVQSRRNVHESHRFFIPGTDLCPKTSQNVRKTSTRFNEIIHSRYFCKHVDHI